MLYLIKSTKVNPKNSFWSICLYIVWYNLYNTHTISYDTLYIYIYIYRHTHTHTYIHIVVKTWIVLWIDFWFFLIVYRKIHKHLIKFIKNYRYAYIKGIFIINFEYIQLMTNLFITYIIIFNKLTKLIKLARVYNIHIQIV